MQGRGPQTSSGLNPIVNLRPLRKGEGSSRQTGGLQIEILEEKISVTARKTATPSVIRVAAEASALSAGEGTGMAGALEAASVERTGGAL
jgi:hypothetical protein